MNVLEEEEEVCVVEKLLFVQYIYSKLEITQVQKVNETGFTFTAPLLFSFREIIINTFSHYLCIVVS